MGQNRMCGLMGLGCKMPCRLCNCPKSELINPVITNCSIRDSDEAIHYLKGAFSSFLKQKKKQILTKIDKEILQFCENNSIVPLYLAVFNIEKPFQDFSCYEYFRPDHMHTLLGRLKTWCFTTIVICHRIAKICKGDFVQSLANLDDALINFLPNHSLPFVFHHFQEGVTLYCLASTDSRNKLTTSGLGKIDYSRMVSLVIQMLISKLIYKKFHIFYNFLT